MHTLKRLYCSVDSLQRRSQITRGLFAIALTVLLLSVLTGHLTDRAFFGGDTWEYQSMAVNTAQGDFMRFGGVLPFERYAFESTGDEPYLKSFLEQGKGNAGPNLYRSPGYPVLLGLLYRIGGVHPLAVKVLQLLFIWGVASLLPLIGYRTGSRAGFWAGLLGGIMFAALMSFYAVQILTETAISASLMAFVASAAWYFHRPGTLRAALCAALTGASLLVKGSIIFLPLLFIAAVLLRSSVPLRERLLHAAAVALMLILIVAPYSRYASAQAGRFVLLSTQGKQVLLDGHNEYAAWSGKWSPQWVENAESFFNVLQQREPGISASAMVLRFYARYPHLAVIGTVRKIDRGLGSMPGFPFLAALLLYVTARRSCSGATSCAMSLPRRICYMLGALTVAHLSITGVACLWGYFFLRGRQAGLALFTREAVAFVRHPMIMSALIVGMNFLLLTVITFGERRFLIPMGFALFPLLWFMTLRGLEER